MAVLLSCHKRPWLLGLACSFFFLPPVREMGSYVERQWQHVRVGDFIELTRDEVIPADILLLHSTEAHGICYIETANIDGETNLKQRQVKPGSVREGMEVSRQLQYLFNC